MNETWCECDIKKCLVEIYKRLLEIVANLDEIECELEELLAKHYNLCSFRHPKYENLYLVQLKIPVEFRELIIGAKLEPHDYVYAVQFTAGEIVLLDRDFHPIKAYDLCDIALAQLLELTINLIGAWNTIERELADASNEYRVLLEVAKQVTSMLSLLK